MGVLARLLGGRHGSDGHGRSHSGSHGRRYRNDQVLPSAQQWGRTSAMPVVTLIACPACGAGSDAGSHFCAQCGAALAPPPCVGCGSAMASGVRFCGQCGKAR